MFVRRGCSKPLRPLSFGSASLRLDVWVWSQGTSSGPPWSGPRARVRAAGRVSAEAPAWLPARRRLALWCGSRRRRRGSADGLVVDAHGGLEALHLHGLGPFGFEALGSAECSSAEGGPLGAPRVLLLRPAESGGALGRCPPPSRRTWSLGAEWHLPGSPRRLRRARLATAVQELADGAGQAPLVHLEAQEETPWGFGIPQATEPGPTDGCACAPWLQ